MPCDAPDPDAPNPFLRPDDYDYTETDSSEYDSDSSCLEGAYTLRREQKHVWNAGDFDDGNGDGYADDFRNSTDDFASTGKPPAAHITGQGRQSLQIFDGSVLKEGKVSGDNSIFRNYEADPGQVYRVIATGRVTEEGDEGDQSRDTDDKNFGRQAFVGRVKIQPWDVCVNGERRDQPIKMKEHIKDWLVVSDDHKTRNFDYVMPKGTDMVAVAVRARRNKNPDAWGTFILDSLTFMRPPTGKPPVLVGG